MASREAFGPRDDSAVLPTPYAATNCSRWSVVREATHGALPLTRGATTGSSRPGVPGALLPAATGVPGAQQGLPPAPGLAAGARPRGPVPRCAGAWIALPKGADARTATTATAAGPAPATGHPGQVPGSPSCSPRTRAATRARSTAGRAPLARLRAGGMPRPCARDA